jgi:hypothetical protein
MMSLSQDIPAQFLLITFANREQLSHASRAFAPQAVIATTATG